jgi:hypothetical protein
MVKGLGYLHRGPLAWQVEVTLRDDGEVRLEPTRWLEQKAGARPERFHIRELRAVQTAWMRGVSVVLPDRTLRLSGPGLDEVIAALHRAVDASAPPARALLSGIADQPVGAGLTQRMEVRLTERALHLAPALGVQAALSGAPPVELPLEWLAAFSFDEGRQIRIFVNGGPGRTLPPVELEGGVAGALAATLAAAGVEEGADARSPEDRVLPTPPLVCGPARERHLLLDRAVHLAIGPGGLSSAAVDLPVLLAGADLEHTPLDRVRAFEVGAGHALRVELFDEDDRTWRLQAAPPGAEALGRVLALRPPDDGPRARTDGLLPPEAAAELVRRAPVADLPSDAQPVCALPVVHLGEQRAHRGWAVLLDAGLLLLHSGDDAAASFTPTLLVDRTRSTQDGSLIEIVANRRHHRLLAVGGPGPARALIAALGAAGASPTDALASFSHYAPLVGRKGWVRLAREHVELVAHRGVEARLEPDGYGVILPGPAPAALTPGLRVEVELGDARTVYTWRTDVLRTQPVEGGTLVVLLFTPSVHRRENQREAFRVPVAGPAELRSPPPPVRAGASMPPTTPSALRPGERGYPGALADLSAGGVAVVLAEALDPGTSVEVRTTIEGTPQRWRAEVVYHRRLPGDEGVHHGLRLRDLSRGQLDALQSLVVRLQMRLQAARDLKEEVVGSR